MTFGMDSVVTGQHVDTQRPIVAEGKRTQALLCVMCKKILKWPLQSSCGCRYCDTCFSLLVGSGGHTGKTSMCVACQEDIDVTRSHPDVCASKEVMGLTVLCSARDAGCQWEGLYKAFDVHRDECKFITVSCPNSGCPRRMERRQVFHHLEGLCPFREHQCPHCYDHMAFQDFEMHLKLICVKVKLDCPNGCGLLQVRRDELRDHLNVCHLQKTHCDFRARGCEYIGCRNTLGSHYTEASTYHSILMNRSLSLCQRSWEPIKRQCDESQREQSVMKARVDQLEKCNSDLSQHVELLLANSRALVSELQDSKQKENKMRQQFESHVEECRALSRSRTDSAASAASAAGAASAASAASIVSASSAAGVRASGLGCRGGVVMATPDTAAAAAQSTCAHVSSVRRDLDKLEDCCTHRMNAVDRSVAVQDIQLSDLTIRMDLNEVKGCRGVLLWRIADLRRRVLEASSGRTPSLYSPPFFTSMYGYKMCARVYLNGDGAGRDTHISLFFVIMHGEFDALLPWPFQQKVKMTLLDQTPTTPPQCQRNNMTETFRPNTSSSSFQRPTSEMNIATGCPQFAPLSVLSSDRFVRDDTLYIRMEVNRLGLRAPDHVAE